MFNSYPYTNFHELNLAYFLQQFEQIFQQWHELYTTMQEWKEDTTQELEAWKDAQEAAMAAWEAAVLSDLNAWKSTTEDDISDWEQSVLNDLNQWRQAFDDLFESIQADAAQAAIDAQTASEQAVLAANYATAASASADLAQAFVGSPLVASTVSAMTDRNKIYVYVGSETGYTSGHWYYYNGSVWADGGIYNSEALQTDSTLSIRGMAADAAATGVLKDAINAISPTPSLSWTLNQNVDGTGSIATNNYMALSNPIPVSLGDLIVRKAPSVVDTKSIIGYVSEFNGTTFIRRSTYNAYDQRFTVTDENTTNVRIAFGRASSSGVQISQSDVDNYFFINIYREEVTKLNGFVNRGAIANLGYTSISQCTEQGYYTFRTDDVSSLSDLPLGWTGGGLVTVYKNGNVVWQRIERLRDKWIRYGLSGAWYHEYDLVYAKYTEEAGDDDSVATLDIYVPSPSNVYYTLFRMGRCVDASKNADVWRIISAYRYSHDGTMRKTTISGEWECALHLAGRNDFSGGIAHGDEIDTSIAVFVDGALTSIDALNTYSHELRIVRHSNLYDPRDHLTVIAEHGVEYIFNTDGLTINQSVEWKVSENLTTCYLGMLPLAKAYSTHRYDDTNFNIVENDQTDYSVIIPKAKSVTEFNNGYGTFFTMGVKTYPTGFTGGDCAIITDNDGRGYNKMYFRVCSSGAVSAGDLWQASVFYKNR